MTTLIHDLLNQSKNPVGLINAFVNYRFLSYKLCIYEQNVAHVLIEHNTSTLFCFFFLIVFGINITTLLSIFTFRYN